MRMFLLIACFWGMTIGNAQNTLNVTHTVQKGETLFKISKDYDMTVSELREMNPQVGVLQPGMKLNVRKKLDVQSRKPNVIIHVVKKGETLYKISQKYKVKVNEIREANGMIDNAISIDQSLKIPTDLQSTGKPSLSETESAANPSNAGNPEPSLLSAQKKASVEAAKTQIATDPEIKGGIIEKSNGTKKTEFQAKSDTKKAIVLDSTASQAGNYTYKTYVWISGLSNNQVVCVINPRTEQMIYALNQGKRNNQSADSIILTPVVAEKLGVRGEAAELQIQYVASKP